MIQDNVIISSIYTIDSDDSLLGKRWAVNGPYAPLFLWNHYEKLA